MNPASDLDELMRRYVDGGISADEMLRLNARLAAESGARRAFADLLNLDAALGTLAEGFEAESPAVPVRQASGRRPAWLALAAALALLAGGAWWWGFANPLTYATVTEAAGVWTLREGAVLSGETHAIEAGTLALVTARGARVVIEAPAEFRFESRQRLRLLRGRLAADVPPAAKGFTVITPAGEAVDLGTRFGVDVPAEGAPEIHVFQGEVIARPSGAGRREKQGQSLRDGDAVSLGEGTSAARELRSAAFIQADEIPGLSAGLEAGQRARSEAALAALRRDPALIALLDFETEPPSDTCRYAQGRWPGSRAPEFVQIGDHLRLDVGGGRDWPQLTLAAWARVDQLGAPYQSLLHTDGWSRSNPGQVHWMITRHTTMRLALIGNTLVPGSDEREGFPDSRLPVAPEQGRWVHLASVYDAGAKVVRFYLNGRFDKETRLELAHPARLGPAQIGNWDQQDRKLSGRLDELVLLGRAMSGAEVRALYEAGNPYR